LNEDSTTVTELSSRVMGATVAAVLPLAALATWLGGASAGFGVVAAGALTVGNFLWLVRQAPRASCPPRQGRRLLGWALTAAARFAVLALALGTLLGSGWAHPLALVGGLSVLPCALVAAGLRAAGRVATDR
jgi:hypothetical protein